MYLRTSEYSMIVQTLAALIFIPLMKVHIRRVYQLSIKLIVFFSLSQVGLKTGKFTFKDETISLCNDVIVDATTQLKEIRVEKVGSIEL